MFHGQADKKYVADKVYYFQKDKIGSGGFAVVYKGIDESSNPAKQIAIKKIDLQRLKSKQEEGKQKRILEKLKHKNIVSHYGVKNIGSYEYILMQYYPGKTLKDKILSYRNNNKKIPQRKVLKYIRDIVCAVYHIHQKGIIHRDIKPANILFDSDQSIKICDFGVSTDESPNPEQQLTLTGGPWTKGYEAPETKQSKYCNKCDIWSVGVVLYEMLFGEKEYFRSEEPRYNLDLKNKQIHTFFKQLIQKMIVQSTQRITSCQLKKKLDDNFDRVTSELPPAEQDIEQNVGTSQKVFSKSYSYQESKAQGKSIFTFVEFVLKRYSMFNHYGKQIWDLPTFPLKKIERQLLYSITSGINFCNCHELHQWLSQNTLIFPNSAQKINILLFHKEYIKQYQKIKKQKLQQIEQHRKTHLGYLARMRQKFTCKDILKQNQKLFKEFEEIKNEVIKIAKDGRTNRFKEWFQYYFKMFFCEYKKQQQGHIIQYSTEIKKIYSGIYNLVKIDEMLPIANFKKTNLEQFFIKSCHLSGQQIQENVRATIQKYK